MSRPKTNQLPAVYWIVTPLFLLLQGWAATQYLSEAPRMVDAITGLGYPLYFAKILAVAKLLGIAAIATGLSPTLKEWAYAGFTFEVCGAFASHLSAGDAPARALVPAAFFVAQLTSYFVWKRSIQQRALRRRRQAYGYPARSAVESHA